MTSFFRCADQGMVESELVSLPGRALLRGVATRLRFVVYAAVWLHSMVIHGRKAGVVGVWWFSLQHVTDIVMQCYRQSGSTNKYFVFLIFLVRSLFKVHSSESVASWMSHHE